MEEEVKEIKKSSKKEELKKDMEKEEVVEEISDTKENIESETNEDVSVSNVEVKNKKKKGKAKKIIIIIILLLAIIIFIWWWFNRKFDFTFKYNNGEENYTVKVKFLNKVKDEDIKRDITLANHTFIDYFETYYLDGKSIEKIKGNPGLESSICKKDFKLNDDKNKCIAINPYDFKKKRITKDTTVEAFWSGIIFYIDPTVKEIYVGESFNISVTLSGTSDTKVNWLSENEDIATVDESGHVIGKKEGKTTIVVESNGIKKTCDVTVITKEQPKQEKKPVEKPVEQPKEEVKDNGTISLSANDQCIIGRDSVTVTANVSNALDDTINWSSLKCFDINKVSNSQVTISRISRGTMCREIEELNPTIIATLNNGNSDSKTFNYEFTLGVTVYDGNKEIQPNASGIYKGNNIKIVTNQSAIFSAVSTFDDTNTIIGSTDNSVSLKDYSRSKVVIRTTCGQFKIIYTEEAIN